MCIFEKSVNSVDGRYRRSMKNVVPVKDVLQKIKKWCARIGKMCSFEKSMKNYCSGIGPVVKNEKCLIFIWKMFNFSYCKIKCLVFALIFK